MGENRNKKKTNTHFKATTTFSYALHPFIHHHHHHQNHPLFTIMYGGYKHCIVHIFPLLLCIFLNNLIDRFHDYFYRIAFTTSFYTTSLTTVKHKPHRLALKPQILLVEDATTLLFQAHHEAQARDSQKRACYQTLHRNRKSLLLPRKTFTLSLTRP
jgi:hypothetical protein